MMFCDLVGSTPLAVRFDPEDLREIVGAYHRVVAETVCRFGGFVAKYMGDGELIYFGYPQAHEEDAERAVRAGLAVVDAAARLDTPEQLSVRLGIASGLVVVGDLIGQGGGAGARRRRRDGEPGGAPASPSQAGHARYRRQHPAADRRAFRTRRSWPATARGLRRAAARLARPRRE